MVTLEDAAKQKKTVIRMEPQEQKIGGILEQQGLESRRKFKLFYL